MLNKVLDWFKAEDPEQEPISVELAAAVLMVEVMAADHEWDDVEEQKIRSLMDSTLKLNTEQQDEVLALAKSEVMASHGLFSFTKRINERYNEDQKYELMVSLWQVAYADGNIDRYEEHMIRKLGELLYLHHSHFIRAKLDAKER
jgi:uncharacterized tellurite resistance protein B-like protein